MATYKPATAKNEASFKGDYLWINHDSENRKALPHRHAVFTHVQGKYSQWKRLEGARQLRASAQIPPGLRSEAQRRRDTSTDVEEQPLPATYAPTEATAAAIDDNAEQSHGVEPGPLTILRQGNSDPFNTFAIQISANINHLMTFCRDLYLPSVNQDANNPQGYSNHEWLECVSALHDKLTAYAHLTRVASVLVASHGSVEGSISAIQALKFKNQSVALLRARLADNDALKDSRTLSAILSLQYAELYARDFTGALFHTKMLAHLLQAKIIKVEMGFMFRVFYYDSQLAAMALTRPCFDLQTWIPDQFASIWDDVQRSLPEHVMSDTVSQGLDPTVDSARLRAIFTDFRHCHAIFILAMKDPSFSSDIITLYLRSRVILSMGRLINHYLDCCEEESNVCGVRYHARVQMYACLAALCWIRCVAHVDSIAIGKRAVIFCANANILTKLREALINSEEHALPNELTKYARLRLWTLYIGAHAEQSEVHFKGETCVATEKKWFNMKLAEQAKQMGLFSWEGVRGVLQGFYYSDGLPPHGSQWFWKTVSANLDPAQ